MHAELDEDPTSVASTVGQVLERFGASGLRRRTGIVLDDGRVASEIELVDAVREFDLGVITLTPAVGTTGRPADH